MVYKMKKMSKKTKFRVTILGISLIIAIVFCVSSSISYISQILNARNQIEDLKVTYNDKLDDEEELKEEINKLQDPEYMAKYAREKYLYSKKDEIIIKIED